MCVNKGVVAVATFGIVIVLYSNFSYAHQSVDTNKPHAANYDDVNDDGYVIPEPKIHYAQLQKHKQMNQHLQPNLTTITSSNIISNRTTSSSSDAISSMSKKSSLQSAFIFNAEVPTYIKSEPKKLVNTVKFASASTSATGKTDNSSHTNLENGDDLSKKIIGSNVATSISVILNGDEPEFADALGQKVPKPQLSLQVSSPIDLLNPDRYEFYTFDEQGELVKRLMTMKDIQSIVANGDDEGPTMIDHGLIDDRDSEKNVQDIVNSVQSVLNKEVESNSNLNTEGLPVFDTPDVSSSWSLILPAIFGNTGDVDIFSHQKPHQIVMTPDAEIIESSTIESVPRSSRKPKPSNKKTGLKRKPTITATQATPQVIQEELDSEESVYTGMQQYQNLPPTMQSYDGISKLLVRPIYHKLPEIETSTRRVFINKQEVLKNPIITVEKENLHKNPESFQNKPLSPHRTKKPNEYHTTTDRHQDYNQKINRKPTLNTKTRIPSTKYGATTEYATVPKTTTTPSPVIASTTSTTIEYNVTHTSTPEPMNTTLLSITMISKSKKKPTPHPVLLTNTFSDAPTQTPYLTAEKRKTSPKPHRASPKPINYQHNVTASDLAAEGTAHQKISDKKSQNDNKKWTNPKDPIRTNISLITTPTTAVPNTTAIFSPTPAFTTYNPMSLALLVLDFPRYEPTANYYEDSFVTTRTNESNLDSHSVVHNVSSSVTSGYPVPYYGTSTYELKDLSTNQVRKRPCEKDTSTLKSFDQIMHSLKHPEQISEQITKKVVSDKLNLKPKNKDENEVTADSQNTIIEDKSRLADVITSAWPHYNLVTKMPEEIITNKQPGKESNKKIEDTEPTTLTSFTSEFSFPKESLSFNNQAEQNTERGVVGNEYQTLTQDGEIPKYTSTAISTKPYTFINNSETRTDVNQIAEDYTETLHKETLAVLLPHKDDTLNIYKSSLGHSILVAKTQLNNEDIKPSELITMSDFQTQGANVASTLIDGDNTIPFDYSLKGCNETCVKTALLGSDFFHQVSNNINKSATKPSSDNDNRFSNQAQPNSYFLKTPTKLEKQGVLNIEKQYNYQQNYKPIYERLENTHTKYYDIESLRKDSTEISETATVKDIQVEIKATESYASTEEIGSTLTLSLGQLVNLTSTGSYDSFKRNLTTNYQKKKYDYNDYKIAEQHGEKKNDFNNEVYTENLDMQDKNDFDNNNTLKFQSVKNCTTTKSISVSGEQLPNLKVCSPPYVRDHLHNFKDEREPLLESDSSVDAINVLLKENIPILSKENLGSVKRQEIVNGEDIILPGINTTNKSGVKSSESDMESKINAQVTMEHAPKSEGKLNFSGSTSITLEFATTESFEWTTSINKHTLSTKQKESEIVEETESNIIREEYTTQYNEADEESTVEMVESPRTENTISSTYQIIKETSNEFDVMISEESDESINEDPYIKLGETTTLQSEVFIEIDTQSDPDKFVLKKKIAFDEVNVVPSPELISAVAKKPNATGLHSTIDNYGQAYEDDDEDDKEVQLSYYVPQTQNPVFYATTTKPKLITTRRLNTLKPVSYFNKHPEYVLHKDSPELLYNKQSLYVYQRENAETKDGTFSISTSQQRQTQRPPQLSNLMISYVQATRPPVNLEPAPNNSKGLESSLSNLDKDILAFSKLCNELTFSYWKTITSERISSARSLVMSPFALTSMLSMVFLGARGSTSGEMNDVLKLDDMATFNPHLIFKNITDSVEKSIDSIIATTAFVREIYSDRANGKVLQFFKEKTQQIYAGHVEEVNFHVVNDIIRRRTNLLVKRHTMGKVLEYLRTNSIWVNGPLATISANLFQTDCSLGSTQDRDGEIFFQVHPTVMQRRLVPIPAVLFKSGFTAGFEADLDATVVGFGHVEDTTSVIYVMPGHLSSISPSDSLDRLEKQLTETAISKNAWSNLLTSLINRPGMEVQIPRFSHRSFVNATLGLKKMGLKGLFKSNYADLGGLTGSSNRDIYLSDMIQINTFSTCGEEKIADHHHIEMYPAPPLRKRNKDVDARDEDKQDSSEAIIDFGSLAQDSVLGRGFYDDLLDPKYLELPLPLRPRQARVPNSPRLRFDRPFLYFVRHNPTGMILFMGRFNPRLLP